MEKQQICSWSFHKERTKTTTKTCTSEVWSQNNLRQTGKRRYQSLKSCSNHFRYNVVNMAVKIFPSGSLVLCIHHKTFWLILTIFLRVPNRQFIKFQALSCYNFSTLYFLLSRQESIQIYNVCKTSRANHELEFKIVIYF